MSELQLKVGTLLQPLIASIKFLAIDDQFNKFVD